VALGAPETSEGQLKIPSLDPYGFTVEQGICYLVPRGSQDTLEGWP